MSRKVVLIGIWALFLMSGVMYLHRLPGLMGDEASEGENVYELLTSEHITVTGERSYIGPLIDYVRVPFIGLFGYTALALRIPILLASLATAFFAYKVLEKQFDKTVALYAAVLFLFSPIYFTYQRLGWAITLFPFFTFLILYFAQSRFTHKWLWVGLAAGVGLANHIVFFPVVFGLLVGVTISGASRWASENERSALFRNAIVAVVLCIVGFWAGFGMQFVVLSLNTDDQGAPSETTQLFSERVQAFKEAAPFYISGSSYVARYTGFEFSPTTQLVITWALILVAVIGVLLQIKNIFMWAWVFGGGAQLLVLLYMIDRFTLRYFVVPSLWIWLLAGIGIGSIVAWLAKRVTLVSRNQEIGALLASVLLVTWMITSVVVPFLKTGGSVEDFSLGDRTNSASALVETESLITCVQGKGPLYSENVHIWNRLQYLSHQYPGIMVVDENHKTEASYIVNYQLNKDEISQNTENCGKNNHFVLTKIHLGVN